MTSPGLVTLYRPVGRDEMKQIAAAEFTVFPPLPDRSSLFYPEITEEHARRLAHDWNAAGAVEGYVTKCAVNGGYFHDRFLSFVTNGPRREYAIPAAELGQFNANIVGRIEVIAQHSGASAEGPEQVLAMTASTQDLAFDLDEQEIPCLAGRHLVHEIRETFHQMHDESADIEQQNAAAGRLEALYKKAAKSHKDS
jgi:hypothetical protein